MDHRSGGAITRGHEHGERTLAGRERRFFVGEVGAIIGATSLVAGEGVQLVEVREQLGRSALAEASNQRSPTLRGGEGTRLTDPFDHAGHQRCAACHILLAQGERQNLGAGAGVAGQAAIDKVGRLGVTADGGEGEATGGVGTDQRLDAIPDQQRDIMILGVFGARKERLGNRRTLGEWQIRKSRSEFATDLRGGFGLGQFRKRGHAGGPLLRNQADGPTAHSGIGILERSREERIVEEVRRLQDPERADTAKRICIRGQYGAQLCEGLARNPNAG